jgi:hypothetical protein
MDDATQKLVHEAEEVLAEWEAHNVGLIASGVVQPREIRALRALLGAAQRPPVSPEVREALVDTLTSPVRAPGSVAASRVFRAETPEDLEDATALADAILAQWSLPVLDVEKVAQWLDEATSACGMGFWATADRDRLAAALVASLHTLTVDGTPSDTERNES